MRPSFVLLPSPFLGPAAWRPVAAVLAARGHRVIIPELPTAAPRTAREVLSTFLEAVPGDGESVLVPHSNAGLYVPALTARARVRGFIFVDAVLPPAGGEMPVAPRALLETMRDLAGTDGLLPPWTQWWDEADVAGLFPDEAARRSVEREQRRIPLSYLEGTVPVQEGWDLRPGAYLAFGDTYAAERTEAGRRRWPAVTLPGSHLHMLWDPVGVADQILALLAAYPNRP